MLIWAELCSPTTNGSHQPLGYIRVDIRRTFLLSEYIWLVATAKVKKWTHQKLNGSRVVI
jgi:hypothetical protein